MRGRTTTPTPAEPPGRGPPELGGVVVPAAVVILVGLFLIQHRGTGSIGRVFGPVMAVRFTVIGLLGAVNLTREPAVVRAVYPGHAARFFADNGFRGFLVLGAVVLVVVGGEALYADMGHFGRRPIVLGWYAWCCPACSSSTSARAPCWSTTPAPSRTPSTAWRRTGASTRWWCWPRWRR